MNFDRFIATVLDFYQNYTLLSIVILIGILIWVWRNPKGILKLIAFLAVLGVIFYFLSLLGGTLSTGMKQKDQMIHKTREAAGE